MFPPDHTAFLHFRSECLTHCVCICVCVYMRERERENLWCAVLHVSDLQTYQEAFLKRQVLCIVHPPPPKAKACNLTRSLRYVERTQILEPSELPPGFYTSRKLDIGSLSRVLNLGIVMWDVNVSTSNLFARPMPPPI